MMMITRSQIASTSDRICDEKRMVLFRASDLIKARISTICVGSKPTVGSSRMRKGGLCKIACAKPTRCRSPLLNDAIGRVR